jgi:hypothetical protein
MRKFTSITAALLLVLLLTTSTVPAQSPQKSQGPTEWIANSLREIHKIKVGMTRGDLLKVFNTEGGLSTGLSRTFIYRECPYIKVDVEFDPVGRPGRNADGSVTLVESNDDVIRMISKPYLDWVVID